VVPASKSKKRVPLHKRNPVVMVVWALGLVACGLTHGNMGFLATIDYGALTLSTTVQNF
jgi:hypothetical protein